MQSSRRFQTPAPHFLRDPSVPPFIPNQAPDHGPLPFEESVDELNEELSTLRILLTNPPTTQNINPIAVKVEDRPFNPYGPADSDNAMSLQHAFKHQGVIGLARTAQRIAREYQNDPEIRPSRNYEVLSGPNGDKDFFRILLTMHAKFTEHLLRGDLMWEYFNNEDFYKAVNIHHPLSQRPGTYIQAVVRNDSELRTPDTKMTELTLRDYRQKNPDAGAWLTGREIFDVYSTAVKYLPSYNGSDESSLAKSIDEMYPGWAAKPLSWYRLGNRRYVSNANEPKFQRWLEAWHNVYITRISALIQEEQATGNTKPILDVPLRSCPLEIGFGTAVISRANAHDAHKFSNALWTFFLALLHNRVDKNATQFAVYRFQTNYLFDLDNLAHHARVADVGTTLIVRSEWHQGGFNLVPGGGAGVSDNPLNDARPWVNESFNATYVENSTFTNNVGRTKEIMDDLKREKSELNQLDTTLRALVVERRDCLARNSFIQFDVNETKKRLRIKRVKDMARGWRRAKGLESPR